ncbi:hypothetical protein SAMN04488564_101930 [Lentzea waywayandensis]|uniref:Uncharacterized protein n=1 Tax=Lentzea waywayandensis TaxID=84724 RepID=A0A1I6D2V7_9PSEU|nr:hypothetical protein [Lentzea waywayandensis]SFQ99799.1 hypothetical protein SAMN04488564_101930 [Lentzea waywayandensis]
MSEHPGPAPSDNPFLMAAVAKPREFSGGTVSIPTPSITEAISIVDSFLRPSTLPAGTVVAIVGEYGTGKSHLVGAVLHHALSVPEERRPRVAFLEARPATFVDLYKQLIGTELRRDDVCARVRELYADVLADALGESELTAEIAVRLRRGEVDPVEVSDRLNLMGSKYLARLRQRLEVVTRNRAFGIVLPLLLRHDFADAAWEWLSGHYPDPVLVDRGVDTPIATEELALEAMGVIALLYSTRGKKFVLAIDEMNKVVSATRKPSENAVDAFEKLIKVFAGAQALLVLAGLPDYLDELGGTVQQRIGRTILISPLNPENAIEYIRQSQEAIGRGRVLHPFTEDTVRYLVKLTDGNARRIIRLCSHLYRHAMDLSPRDPARALVTEAMVRKVAREQAGARSTDHVRNEIRQVLAALGLSYERDHWMDPQTDSRADYWVPYGDEDGAGCALVLIDAVLTQGDCDALVSRATFLQTSAEQRQVLLVVVGLLNADFVSELGEAFSEEPISYDHWTFTETLSSVLERQLRTLDRDDTLVLGEERFRRLGRQQANTQRMLEQALKTLTAMRSSSERSLGQIQRELTELSTADRAAHPGTESPPLRLPPPVMVLFTRAQSFLDGLDQVDATLRTMFAAASGDSANAIDARVAVRGQLRSPHLFSAVGVGAMLRTLLVTFRDSINEWYRSYVPSSSGDPYPADKDRLSALCLAYDTVYEYVPFYRLEDLDGFSPQLLDGNVLLPPQVGEAQEVFNLLSGQVQAAVLESVAESR